MASRRGLKKDLNYLYSDLMLDAFAAYSNSESQDDQKANTLLKRISGNYADFVRRVSHTDGKQNKKVVKAYYQGLWKSVLDDVLGISEEIEKL